MSDRDMECDRCGAPHHTEWWKPEQRATIRLCAHHDRQHRDALQRDGFTRYERITEGAKT